MKKYFIKPAPRVIAITAVMIAMEVVLHRFASIQTPILQLHFGFLPIATVAILFGPVYSGVAWAIADVIGMLLFPTGGGTWYIGLTVSLFVTGVIYGIFLYGGSKNILMRIILSTLIVSIFITLILDTFWLHLYWGNGIIAMLPSRILKCIVMIPLQIIGIFCLERMLDRYGIKRKFGRY